MVNRNLDVQELSVVLIASDQNPALITLEFLQGSGIIPSDWQLTRSPILSRRASQLTFQNGVSIFAQPGSVTFSMTLGAKGLQGEPEVTNFEAKDINLAEIVEKYVRVLPNLQYQAIRIQPRRFVSFEDQQAGGIKFINETLIAPGPWTSVGDETLQANLSFSYTLGERKLNITISEAKLQIPEQEPVSSTMFSGNFTYEVVDKENQDKLDTICHVARNLESDLDIYQNIVETKFLVSAAVSHTANLAAVAAA